jgi:hypothetical protein
MNLLDLLLVSLPSTKAPAIAPPTPAPPPPTIDQAVQNQNTANDLRQRRGAMANVLAGQNPASPNTLAAGKLLGQ